MDPMELQQLDLNLLKAFDALMRERNVTRAAERMSLTQPAVSGILNRLRESFDDPLFVRTPRGISPTPRALALSAPIQRVLQDIDRLLKPDAFDPAQASFTVSVAATDYALRAVVVPLISVLQTQAPGIRVAVRPVQDRALMEQMERGDVDLALLTPQTAPPDLHSRRLFEERYVCILRQDHPLAARRALSLNQFCRLGHGMVSLEGGGFHGATDDALATLGHQRRVVVSVPSFAMLLDVVRTSDLTALVPERLLEGAHGLVTVRAPVEVMGFSKILVWHARTHDEPGHRWVREQLVQACGTGA